MDTLLWSKEQGVERPPPWREEVPGNAWALSPPSALESAVENLNEAKNYFAKVDCKERIRDVVYFQARLYHTLGRTQERNRCAMLFRQLHQELPSHGVPLINHL